MEFLLTNTGGLLALFVFLLGALHLIFINLFPRDDLWWKKANYIVLFVAGLGIISTTSYVRTSIEGRKYENAKLQANVAYETFINHIGPTEAPSYICRIFEKSEFSPQNWEQTQAAYDSLCEWTKALLRELPEDVDKDFPDLTFEPPPKDIAADPEYLRKVIGLAERYNRLRETVLELKEKSSVNRLEEILFYLTPFLLCFVVALSITKVTAELKFESGR